MILNVFLTLLFSLATSCSQYDPPLTEKDKELRPLLFYLGECESIDEEVKRDPKILTTIESVIADPKSHPRHTAIALTILSRYSGDRSRYREVVIRRVTDKHWMVRLSAATSIGEIGTSQDTPPLIALLSDEDTSVVYMSAKAIAKIGGRRDVVAFDAWLMGSAHKDAIGLRKDIKECRDALQKRLDEEEKRHPMPRKP
jgi:hypothetical protein